MIMQILGCIHLAHTRSIEVRTQTKLSFVQQGLSAASFFLLQTLPSHVTKILELQSLQMK